jgi:hypothetical protein
MRILAGGLPKPATLELMGEIVRSIRENALHVNALYFRLREIQFPTFQTPPDQTLVTLMTELLHPPEEFALVLGRYRVVTPSLIEPLAAQDDPLAFPPRCLNTLPFPFATK